MNELIVSPDVETAIIEYLQERLLELGDTAHVGDKPIDGRCVRVIKTGGQQRLSRVLTQPQVTIDSYDSTEAEAGRLAALVSGLMFQLEGTVQSGVVFAAVSHFGEASNFPDPLDQRPRYTETFIPRARAIAL